jgi:hypothetical protein
MLEHFLELKLENERLKQELKVSLRAEIEDTWISWSNFSCFRDCNLGPLEVKNHLVRLAGLSLCGPSKAYRLVSVQLLEVRYMQPLRSSPRMSRISETLTLLVSRRNVPHPLTIQTIQPPTTIRPMMTLPEYYARHRYIIVSRICKQLPVKSRKNPSDRRTRIRNICVGIVEGMIHPNGERYVKCAVWLPCLGSRCAFLGSTRAEDALQRESHCLPLSYTP